MIIYNDQVYYIQEWSGYIHGRGYVLRRSFVLGIKKKTW